MWSIFQSWLKAKTPRQAFTGRLSGRAALAVAAAAGVCLFAQAPGAAAQEPVVCAPDVVVIRGDFGEMRFDVLVADDASERGRGLMHVPEMPRSEGMLFVYERPQQVAFWMKNTLIGLDMLFIDARGEVLQIHENAIPGDLTPIPSTSDQILAVLEINGGLSATLGLSAGDVIAHPAFGPDAALACAD